MGIPTLKETTPPLPGKKYDPIPTKDYYAQLLSWLFSNMTRFPSATIIGDGARDISDATYYLDGIDHKRLDYYFQPQKLVFKGFKPGKWAHQH